MHAGECDQAETAVAPELREKLPDIDVRIDLVDRGDVDGGIGAEHTTPGRVTPQGVKHG